MVEITHIDGCIAIKGHAEHAVIGHDIVCAAVSALVQTFIESVECLTTDKIKAVENEQGQIQAIQYKSLSTPGQVLLGSFLIGIRMIAEAYPANVRLISS